MTNYIFRALPLNRDSRTQRYANFLEENAKFNTWEDYYSDHKKGIEKLKIARNRTAKIITYPLYLVYLYLFSLFRIKNENRVICMDLDTFFPVFLGSFWKKTTIYFDIVDPIAQTKFRKFYWNKLFDYIEYFLIKFRIHTIIPNKNRLEYYKDRLNIDFSENNVLIIENIPVIDKSININSDFKNKPFEIGYFGTLDKSRGLTELVDFVSKNKEITLLIAGMGQLKDFIAEKANYYDNIKFLGAFNSKELVNLYNQVKFCWAYYTDKTFLHKYASPNKYYEHLVFKTPIIINRFIPLSKSIEFFNSGIIINDELSDLTFNDLKFKIKKYNFDINSFSEWEDKYENYNVDFKLYEKMF